MKLIAITLPGLLFAFSLIISSPAYAVNYDCGTYGAADYSRECVDQTTTARSNSGEAATIVGIPVNWRPLVISIAAGLILVTVSIVALVQKKSRNQHM